jgi:hypothetical protein
MSEEVSKAQIGNATTLSRTISSIEDNQLRLTLETLLTGYVDGYMAGTGIKGGNNGV